MKTITAIAISLFITLLACAQNPIQSSEFKIRGFDCRKRPLARRKYEVSLMKDSPETTAEQLEAIRNALKAKANAEGIATFKISGPPPARISILSDRYLGDWSFTQILHDGVVVDYCRPQVYPTAAPKAGELFVYFKPRNAWDKFLDFLMP